MRMRSWEWIASLMVTATFVGASGCSDDGSPVAPPTTSAGSATAAGVVSPASPRRTIARPPWATHDRFLGRVAADRPMSLQIHLRMRDEDAAAAELAAISD